MSERLLRLPAVLDRSGYRRSSLYARIAEGLFPAPISLGGRSVAWLESETAAVIAARVRGESDAQIRQLVSDLTQQRTGMAA